VTTEQRERKRQWQRRNRERQRAERRRELAELNPMIADLTPLEELARSCMSGTRTAAACSSRNG
jgi:hypothetical protein